MISFKELSYRVLSIPYKVIFKESMTHKSRMLFVGTSYAAFGMLFGALLTFAFTILGARILGPQNFGNYTLVVAVSVVFGSSMQFCLTPALKYAAGKHESAVRANIVSTSSVLVVACVIISAAVYTLIAVPVSHVLGIPVVIFLFGVLYAVSVTFFVFTMNTLRALFRLRTYAVLNTVQSIIVLGTFLLFISISGRAWEYAVYPAYIANFAISALLILYLGEYLNLRYDRSWAKKITRYARFSAPGAVAIACMGVDTLLINAFKTTADVGIYNAYFMPSITSAVLVWSVFNAAFFPYASGSDDRQAIFRTVNRAVPYTVAFFLPAIILLEAVAFFFYGSQYPFSWEIAFFFALSAAIYVLFQCYSFLMASEGTSGAKAFTLGNIIALVALVSFNVLLIPVLGILGAAITLVFTYSLPTLYLVSRRHILSGT